MARYKNIQTNFSGGLVTDYLVGRSDLDRVENSARKFDNFLPTVQGPAEYRPGFNWKYTETDTNNYTNSVSISLVFATNNVYRCVFGGQEIKIFDTSGVLIDTVTSPYSVDELKDLRFSSETDELHVVHPNHRPKVLTATSGLVYTGFNLATTESDSTNDDLFTSGGFGLTVQVGTVANEGDWTLSDAQIDVEPFLESDTSSTKLRLTKGEEIVKIVSTDAGLATITSAGTPTDFYVQYDIDGRKIIGKVISSSTNYPEVVAPAVSNGVYTIYVDAVDFITEITDPNAKLFLLDNAETTNGSVQEKQLIQEGVPDGEVHLRSDVDIFNSSVKNTFIRVGSNRRIDKTVIGQDTKFNLTRWLKVTEYKAIEAHPVDFYRGAKFIEETSATHDYSVYDVGSIYKAYGDSDFTLRNLANAIEAKVVDNGNRVFVWNGGEFTGDTIFVYNEDNNISRSSEELTFIIPLNHGIEAGDTINIAGLTVSGGTSPNGDQTVASVTSTSVTFDITGLQHDPSGHATLTLKTHSTGTNPVVGNLSTAKSLEVVKCDPSLVIQEYDASLNTGGLLVSTTAANTTVTEIANDVTITADKDLFDSTTDVDRHIRAELPSGMVYMKILEYTDAKNVRAKLNSPVPRDSVTGEFEADGIALSFNMGAWFTANYPRAVAKYEQRRIYGGTYSNPNFVFVSRLSNEGDFSPTQNDKLVLDTDGFSYALSNVNASIVWIQAARDLVIGTSKGIFKLIINQFQASVSPRTVRFELVDEIGCKDSGVLAGTSIFFPDESNTELLEYKFDADSGFDITADQARLIYPTFVSDPIKKVEFQNNPQPRVWILSEAGKLYCLTYHKQENYYAWSKHESAGEIKDITVLRKGYNSGLDQVWITKQDVPSINKLSHQVLFSENNGDGETTHFLDTSITEELDALSNFERGFLEIPITYYSVGQTISVVVDGVYVGDYNVRDTNNIFVPSEKTSGTFSVAYGRRYTGTLQMMYPTWSSENKPAFGTEEARVVSQKVFVIDSHRFKQGVDGKHTEVKLPGFVSSTSVSPYTGFDKERPIINSQFGVEKLPELVQDQPYKTVFGSLVTKTDLN